MKNYLRIVVCFLAIIVMMVAALAVASADVATYRVQTQDGDPLLIRDEADPTRVLGKVPDGATVTVYRIDNNGYHRAYIEYEGVSGLFVCSDYLVPADENVVITPVKKEEKLYSTNGCTLYRVKLTIKNYVNVQNSPSTTGGTQKRVFEDDDVWVKSFFTRDDIRWAAIILPTGQKRYVEARFLEKVTEETERIEYPMGTYLVINEDAKMIDRATNRNCKTVRNLHEGYEVHVLEDCGAWVKCTYTDQKGKVFKGYVRGRNLELIELDLDNVEDNE